MKILLRSMALIGVLIGGGLAVERVAEACADYRQDTDGNCTCRPNQLTGYESCTQAGRACILVNSGCGGSPGHVVV
jgi:hypothetical protein